MWQTARMAFLPVLFAVTENHSLYLVIIWFDFLSQMLYGMQDALVNGYTNGRLCLDIME